MRLRKVKSAESIVQNNPDICISKPEDFQNEWNILFKNTNPIYLEIGCGKGKFLSESATNHKDINYVGIEVLTSVICRAIQKIEKEEKGNCLLINDDANKIVDFFGKGEIDNIYLNFSDPWPKKRHKKRRLTSLEFLKKYEFILKENGHIFFKTDNFDFFEFSKESMEEKMDIESGTINYEIYQGETTEFEDKFRSQGNPIYYINGTFRR